ncbi:Gfo/Idh/MocA family oxidoreductase [Candidatus Obscuribacterales bacterium]|nr:Gfo/Idh/MocA family oxidoreductase [Candidatus Obscuribacterales bacterium]
MRRLKWGVLGGSGFARRRSIPAMMLSPVVELLGVASRSREKSEKFAEQFSLPEIYDSYDHMLDDPHIEAVHIPLPNSMHCEWAIKAMEKGKHVLVEKPFATNVADLLKVKGEVVRTGLKVMEAMMWPFHPQHRKAKELIAQDAIGKVRLVRSSFTYLLTAKTGIRLDKELGGGCLLDVGCYPVSAARYYFAEEPTNVFARGDIHAELDVDTNISGILEFPSGRALFDAGYHLPYRTDLEVVGEKGRIYFPRAWQPHETASIFLNEEEIVLPTANHYLNLFDHFSNAALNDTSLEFDVEDALKQMRVLDAIKCSILLN